MKTMILAAILISGCTPESSKPSCLFAVHPKTLQMTKIATFEYLGGEGPALCDWVRANFMKDYPEIQSQNITCERR
jgi:hypothetical protein